MALAVWALMKSMSRHMNRVDFTQVPDPEAEQAEPEPADAEASGQGKKQG
jgi:hypothetical protein